MKALKVLVLSMAAALVVGVGFLIWGLSGGAKSPSHSPAKPAGHFGDFGQVDIDLPQGSRISQILTAGDRIVVRIEGGGSDRLVVLDPVSGHVSGSFVLQPAQ